MTPDYAKLYHLMLHASEAAIAAIEKGDCLKARQTLIDAELEAEELYLQQTEDK